jgi:hypothetical protein
MVIDNLTTQIEIQVVGGALPNEDLNLSTFQFRQSGFADVKLHWEHSSTVEPGSEALTDLAEEVVLEAVRNTELKVLLADLLFYEVSVFLSFSLSFYLSPSLSLSFYSVVLAFFHTRFCSFIVRCHCNFSSKQISFRSF